MTTTFTPSAGLNAIRAQLDHPIVDGDGHFIEFIPRLLELVGQVGGEGPRRHLAGLMARGQLASEDAYLPARAFWGIPQENTLDRMTMTLPRLMYERLDELGLDYALLYPTFGLAAMCNPIDEVRQATCRALNLYVQEAHDGLRDRLEPVATIPMFTPDEALAELDHAVGTLGLKAVVMCGSIPRHRRPDGSEAVWIDTLGHGSLHDYDPLWQRCQDLGVVPAFHGIGYGWGSRTSATNYMYNHLGSFAAAQEGVCRSLLMGGATQRFSGLRFAFLEGGATWACQLLCDLMGHFDKRNAQAMSSLDPAHFDLPLALELFERYAPASIEPMIDRFRHGMTTAMNAEPPADLDEFADSGFTSVADIIEAFSDRLFFGCEADDPMNALAFDQRVLPAGARVNATFASDLGHWDVTDARGVLHEAYELVEHGLLEPGQFRDFAFGNVVRMLTDVNPNFFDGTVIEKAVNAEVRA